MKNCKLVLIIEDDRDLRDNISDCLKSEGYQVLEAENGQAGLNILTGLSSDSLPSCILLDYMMPVMDGKTFMKTLEKNHEHNWAKIPIVLATAKGNLSSELSELPLVKEVLKKPMDIDNLLQIVEKYSAQSN